MYSKLKPLKTTFASSHGAPKNEESTTCKKNIIIKKKKENHLKLKYESSTQMHKIT
jgi:hypothetical protein